MIVPMKKVSLVCSKQDKDALLCSLQKCGELMLVASSPILDTQDHSQKTEELLKIVRRYRGKRGIFSPKAELDSDTFFEEDSAGKELAYKLQKASDSTKHNQSVLASLKTRLSQLEPWLSLDVPVEQLISTADISVKIGCVPLNMLGTVGEIIADLGGEWYRFGNLPEGTASVILCFRADEAEMYGRLEAAGFFEISLPSKSGIIRLEYDDTKDQIENIKKELDQLEQNILRLTSSGDELELYSDRQRSEKARKEAPISETMETIYLEGWARSDRMATVKKAIENITDIYDLSFDDPQEDDNPPTVTKNNWFTTAFESITDMFSRPSQGELDPNPVMAPMYWIIFGLMMGDAGYGLLMVVLISLFKRLKKPRGSMEKLVNVLLYSSVTTMIFGVLFGSYFGETWNPILLSPLDAPLSMLILSMGVGILHIFAGMSIAMADSIRKGRLLDAVFDQLSWMIMIIGLGFLFLPALSKIGMIMAVLGAGIVLCTAGRNKKGVLRKVTGGLLGLYNISGFFSDILSYSRILALSLSTSVVAMVMNMLARMVQGSVIGFILSLGIYIVGHLFNLAMGLLSAYVHDSRLQYIEFFGKFYEGGGIAFRPLKINTKYVDVKNGVNSGGN